MSETLNFNDRFKTLMLDYEPEVQTQLEEIITTHSYLGIESLVKILETVGRVDDGADVIPLPVKYKGDTPA